MIFNDEGQIGGIVRSERNIAHRLIEEFMLLANETVARHLEALDVPSLYRIHEEPNPTKVEEFAEIAESFGHKFSMRGPVPQRGFQRLARRDSRAARRANAFLLDAALDAARQIRAQEPGPLRAGDEDLHAFHFAHSPLPRSDRASHTARSAWSAASAAKRVGKRLTWAERRRARWFRGPCLMKRRKRDFARRSSIAEHSSERERAADDAERELMDWRKADFMAAQTGEEFDGVITSVKDYGFYVELNEFFVEGLVHISTLMDDEYEYQERKHRLVGARTNRRFRLGDAVRISVDRVDRARHLIDFSVV